ncbi:hypothetical protein [Nitrosomonas sp. ANs5]|uniref:hypothetical protein n=1 Tax=Nitrosomonas sp. ANs5 TaxID=3423941 RepID=UPI003D354FD3
MPECIRRIAWQQAALSDGCMAAAWAGLWNDALPAKRCASAPYALCHLNAVKGTLAHCPAEWLRDRWCLPPW